MYLSIPKTHPLRPNLPEIALWSTGKRGAVLRERRENGYLAFANKSNMHLKRGQSGYSEGAKGECDIEDL